MAELVLAGDVGGTKAALAVVERRGETLHFRAEATYETRRFAGLEAVIADFLSHHPLPVKQASFSVAGLVDDFGASLPNLGWRVDSAHLRARFALHGLSLVNDLQATAHSIPFLPAENIHVLQAGVPRAGEPIAVIAPGTGLGEGFLISTPGGYVAQASEGGNADFAPVNAEQVELLTYLLQRHDHVSYEMVCSGLGIPNIYRFLMETGEEEEPEWLTRRLAEVDDPTPVIVESALNHEPSSAVCTHALRLFVSILGAEAGNMALRLLAGGGVYLAGGIPPRILPWLQSREFLQAFRGKGRLSGFVSDIPVQVVLEPRAALLGAAHFGLAAAADPRFRAEVAGVSLG